MILVAVDNEYIKKSIDEIYGTEVYQHDIGYMEGVIEYLSKQRGNINNITLITKDTLNGNLKKELYIKQIRVANNEVKIILLTEFLDEQYKEFLFANEVFNVIEGKEVDINNIIQNIESNDRIIYKTSIIEKENKSCSSVIAKQLISVYGTSGAGKSYISSLLAKSISNNLKIKISLLDMDIQNACLDIYNNLSGAGNILSQIVDDIDKNRNINDSIQKYMYKSKSEKNLSYMTSNTSIYECQNKLNTEYYKKIYYSIINNNDYVVVDLPSSPFVDVVRYTLNISSTIFFVINPNYISLRQGIKYLELITKLWGISKDKIYIIVNKRQKSSLDICQIKNLLDGYNIVSNIDFDVNLEGYINGISSNLSSKLNEKEIINSLGVNCFKNDNTSIKNILISMFINKERMIKNDNKSIQN